VFERVARIYVRDIHSQELLREMGVKKDSILMPDLVFSLLPEQLADQPLKSEDEALQVGVTVIDRGAQYGQFRGQQAYEDAVVAALRQITQHRPAHLHIFSQCFGPSADQDDRPVAERIYARVQAFTSQAYLHNDLRDALELRKVYQSMDCMIGSRMHTAILSLISGVPVVLIGYQPKAQGMMAFFGFEPYVIPIEAATSERLSQVVLEMVERRAELRAVIVRKTRELAQRLVDWEENLLE
jgi:polysaccharide pyruvyl transferase WcaK-like protein